ncbi:DNA-binding MarR family transcriptional regulator [Kutzneria viridogrisea]|nr:DNA-binding MarR family transcriptional regulator [Kutzneria viridogrisea]
MTAGQAEPRWLDEGEMAAWRAYRVASILLEGQLHRELADTNDITLADYEVLVRLSERPDKRMRMSQLAIEVASSKSRVSHQIARMERAGLVSRNECPSDGRGVFAALTDLGMAKLREAAPTHVRGVRSHIVDMLSPEEQQVLAQVFERLNAHLRQVNPE